MAGSAVGMVLCCAVFCVCVCVCVCVCACDAQVLINFIVFTIIHHPHLSTALPGWVMPLSERPPTSAEDVREHHVHHSTSVCASKLTCGGPCDREQIGSRRIVGAVGGHRLYITGGGGGDYNRS